MGVHKPLPTHKRIHFDQHPIIALVGPWGSGKSTIDAIELAAHCHRYNCDALVVRDTYPALKDSCCAKWEELFGGLGQMNWGPPPTWHWTNELAGRKVLFRSAEDAKDIQKFGSVEVGCAWLEEVTPGLLPGGMLNLGMQPEILGAVLGRIRLWHDHERGPQCSPHGQRCTHRKLFLSALPPPSTKHWFHKLFYDRQPLSHGLSQEQLDAFTSQSCLYRLTPEENLPNLGPDYYAIQAAFLTDEDQRARFLRGEVGSGYGRAAIYAEYWNDAHINERIEPSDGPMILGLDGGLDASAVWLQPQASGRIFCLAELPTQGLGLEDFAVAVIQHGAQLFGQRYYTAWADPAIFARGQGDGRGGDWYLRQGGLMPRASVQDPALRIAGVRTLLGRFGKWGPLLQVHPRCEMLIEGYRGSYHWKIAAGAPIVGKPDKNEFSHIHDANQYGLAPLARLNQQAPTPLPTQPSADRLGKLYQGPFGQPRYTRRARS